MYLQITEYSIIVFNCMENFFLRMLLNGVLQEIADVKSKDFLIFD